MKALIRGSVLVLLLICLKTKGQPGPAFPGNITITVKGNAVNSSGLGGLYEVIVINQRTSEGMMAEGGGQFKINVLKTDTILISASGYGVKKLCFRDSAYKSEYSVTVKLDAIQYTISEVKIYPKKNLKEINDEKEHLGEVPNTNTYQGYNDFLNPITALYERFSRVEQSKRKVAQLEDDQKRRDVLKDMLHLYIRYDIITLSDEQFDQFIDYMNLSDNFIKNSTDYELITAIKQKYEQFEKSHSYYSPPTPYVRYDR